VHHLTDGFDYNGADAAHQCKQHQSEATTGSLHLQQAEAYMLSEHGVQMCTCGWISAQQHRWQAYVESLGEGADDVAAGLTSHLVHAADQFAMRHPMLLDCSDAPRPMTWIGLAMADV
jgi:hypothetical protein